MVDALVAMTGLPAGEAAMLLEAAGGSVDVAIAIHFDGGLGGRACGGGPPSPRPALAKPNYRRAKSEHPRGLDAGGLSAIVRAGDEQRA